MMNKKNQKEPFKKNAITHDMTRSFFYGKNINVFSSGKSFICGAIMKTFKPLVYSDKARNKNYIKTCFAMNKAVKVAGAVGGAIFSIVNCDKLPPIGTYEFPINMFLETPLVVPLLGWGGKEFANRLHCKLYNYKFSKDAKLPVITAADILYGENTGHKDEFKGIIKKTVDRAENFLKENNPLLYENVNKQVDIKIEKIEEKAKQQKEKDEADRKAKFEEDYKRGRVSDRDRYY
ncbi:MAG: hypothetical protein BWY78_01265 [Alphaproteobacteria bacterium ADurb.Bin438]|nr:MAG: hypothetical protein BWY78_01265 [Alphaproteobacteria bacterium ADurb.Bin438]